MNSASQNFPHHLGALCERMLHPTDYELAVNYFLEEFADDVAFVRGSEPEQMPHLVAALNIVTSKAVGRYLSATASGVRGSVTAGRYSATNVRVHQPRSSGFVKR